MTAGYVVEWLVAFGLTQAVEAPIYARVLAPPRRALRALLPSALTHPAIWFAIAPRWTGSYLAMVVVAETFAVAVETLALVALRARRPLAWSAVANAASFAAGMLAYGLRGLA